MVHPSIQCTSNYTASNISQFVKTDQLDPISAQNVTHSTAPLLNGLATATASVLAVSSQFLTTDALDITSADLLNGNTSQFLPTNVSDVFPDGLAFISSRGWRVGMGWRNNHADTVLTTEKVVAIVIVTILNILMLIGNTISIVTIIKTPNLRNQTYYWFVLNLAIVDLLNSTTVVPIHTVWEAHGPWPFGQTFCDFVIFLDMAFSAIASYSTVLVSLDKFICITKPFLYHHNKASMVASSSVIAVWVVWLTFSAVSVFAGIARDPFLDKNQTYRMDPCNFMMTNSYAISSAIVSFFIPLIIIVFTSMKIVCVARQHICRIAANKLSPVLDDLSSGNEKTPEKITYLSPLSVIFTKKLQQTTNGDISQTVTTESTSSKRFSKSVHPFKKTFSVCRAFGTVMIVTVFFIVMFAPYWFAAIIDVGCKCIPTFVFEDYLMVFYYMHSLVNPYIYMATDRRYKKAILKLYQKYFKRNKIHVVPRTSLSKDRT